MGVQNASKRFQLLHFETNQITLCLTGHFGSNAQWNLTAGILWNIGNPKQPNIKGALSENMAVDILHYSSYHNYYDVIRFCIVDPVHNLLLGTAKYYVDCVESSGCSS